MSPSFTDIFGMMTLGMLKDEHDKWNTKLMAFLAFAAAAFVVVTVQGRVTEKHVERIEKSVTPCAKKLHSTPCAKDTATRLRVCKRHGFAPCTLLVPPGMRNHAAKTGKVHGYNPGSPSQGAAHISPPSGSSAPPSQAPSGGAGPVRGGGHHGGGGGPQSGGAGGGGNGGGGGSTGGGGSPGAGGGESGGGSAEREDEQDGEAGAEVEVGPDGIHGHANVPPLVPPGLLPGQGNGNNDLAAPLAIPSLP